jgi:hypothetical protein
MTETNRVMVSKFAFFVSLATQPVRIRKLTKNKVKFLPIGQAIRTRRGIIPAAIWMELPTDTPESLAREQKQRYGVGTDQSSIPFCFRSAMDKTIGIELNLPLASHPDGSDVFCGVSDQRQEDQTDKSG